MYHLAADDGSMEMSKDEVTFHQSTQGNASHMDTGPFSV